MGLFRRATPMDGAAIEKLQAELATMKAALTHQRSATDALARRVHRRPDDSDAPDHARLDELAAKLAALEARPSDLPDPGRLEELTTKLAEIDARVTSVSTELANQLTELGHDIDAIGARPPGDGPGEAVLGELRDGQVRLATEQARYQIAFREDLARLAEQVRRPGTA